MPTATISPANRHTINRRWFQTRRAAIINSEKKLENNEVPQRDT